MLDHCLAESEESSSASKEKASRQSGSSKTMLTAKQCSEKIFQESQCMMTSHKSTSETLKKWTFSQGDSPVKMSALQGKEQESKEKGQGFGHISQKPFAYFDQESSSWKTFQVSLLQEWVKFSETWPRAGMMRNGILYRLLPLELRISEKESSSWPTPDCQSYRDGRVVRKEMKGKHSMSLHHAVQMWPTPTTPRPHDNEKTVGKYLESQNQKDLTEAVAKDGGQLNPMWVEWLMGFPQGWTVLSVSETPSFRKSLKSSQKESKRNT